MDILFRLPIVFRRRELDSHSSWANRCIQGRFDIRYLVICDIDHNIFGIWYHRRSCSRSGSHKLIVLLSTLCKNLFYKERILYLHSLDISKNRLRDSSPSRRTKIV